MIKSLAEKQFNSTYTLCLEFVIQGNISAVISTQVFENEKLEDEIEKIKQLANTMTFFGGPIYLDHLYKRIQSSEPYIIEDNLHTFSVKVPDYISIGATNDNNNILIFGFPEMNNVINAVALTWDYKTDYKTFKEFIEIRDQRLNDQRDDSIVLKETLKERRIFYTNSNAYFHCQEVLLEMEDVYIQLIFTATEETYNFNLNRFNELVENVK